MKDTLELVQRIIETQIIFTLIAMYRNPNKIKKSSYNLMNTIHCSYYNLLFFHKLHGSRIDRVKDRITGHIKDLLMM